MQLTGTVSADGAIKVYDIDLFDTAASAIAALKSQGGRVICHFSAGSSEDWRSDFAKFLPADKGADMVGWPGERWLDTASANVRSIKAPAWTSLQPKGMVHRPVEFASDCSRAAQGALRPFEAAQR